MAKKPVSRVSANTVLATARDIATRGLNIKPADFTTLTRILTAMCKHESQFDLLAKNTGSTARGPMQILLGTQKSLEQQLKLPHAPQRIYELPYAMLLAMFYVLYQYKRYGGDWTETIIGYNQGSYSSKTVKKGTPYYNAVMKEYRSIPFESIEGQL